MIRKEIKRKRVGCCALVGIVSPNTLHVTVLQHTCDNLQKQDEAHSYDELTYKDYCNTQMAPLTLNFSKQSIVMQISSHLRPP